MATKDEQQQRTVGQGLASLGKFLLTPTAGIRQSIRDVSAGTPTGFQGVDFSPVVSGLGQALIGSPIAPALGLLDQRFSAPASTQAATPATPATPATKPAVATAPTTTSAGQPFTPQPMLPLNEAYPGQASTEAKLRAFDQIQAQAATPAQTTSAINADLTNALLRTALGQTTQQPGAGIDFGASDLARQNAAVANPFAQQFNNLLGQVTALANTTPSGSDSFVDYFNKAAARKRGQEGLVKLAELAGQATSAQAGQQLQAQTEQARLQQAGQEAQQRNALLAGQTLLQTQTSLAEKNAALEAAKAKAAAEAPKTQAETAKLLGEVQNQALINNLNQSIAKAAASGQPVPQEVLNLASLFKTGQVVQPTGTETKVVTDAQGNQSLVTLNKQTGTVLNAGTPGQLLEQQHAKSALAANPDMPYRSAVNPSLVYYIDPTTKTMTSGTLQQYAAAVGGK